MNNWNEFIGKKVIIIMATSAVTVGSSGMVKGTIKNVDDNSILLSIESTKQIGKGFNKSKNTIITNMLINKNYIITIKETNQE